MGDREARFIPCCFLYISNEARLDSYTFPDAKISLLNSTSFVIGFIIIIRMGDSDRCRCAALVSLAAASLSRSYYLLARRNVQ